MITEELQAFIREEVRKAIIEEMAMTASKYYDTVEHLIQQIAENWCLIRYCTLLHYSEGKKNHWRSELLSYMENIASRKIKNGNSPIAKEKLLLKAWNERDFDTDENCIALAVVSKFRKEGFSTMSKEFVETTIDFKNSMKDIVEAILSESYNTIFDYVQTI